MSISQLESNSDEEQAVYEASNATQAIFAWSQGVLPTLGYDLNAATLITKGTRKKPAFVVVVPAPQPPLPYEILN